ncbi:four helix bundle protein [Niabella sp.]|uniref:four helix bundle protein n=1 Tax=Niabella sp. TaxID=1962976 RepID=UPI00260D7CB0|nr:four helix bundle protein [Niabella sp.]
MRDFTKLTIWQRSHLLTLSIYHLTTNFPKEEQYGLILQIRKSAYSVPTNIAEGCGRRTIPQLRNFLDIAAGSISELHYQLILSKDLSYIPESTFQGLSNEAIEIKKMICAYMDKL